MSIPASSQHSFLNGVAGRLVLMGVMVVISLCGSLSLMARSASAETSLNIESWKNYGALAEQGALCAGFASIMESQDILYPELGQLWSERRKFSGAVIRRASEMENGAPAPGEEIDQLIAQYRRWLIVNLNESRLTSSDGSEALDMSVEQMRDMLGLNCASLFASADEVILKRFPELRYLSEGSQRPSGIQANSAAQTQAIERAQALSKQVQLMQSEMAQLQDKVVELRKENSSLKGDNTALQETLAATRKTAQSEIAALETARQAEQSALSDKLDQANAALKKQKLVEQQLADQKITDAKSISQSAAPLPKPKIPARPKQTKTSPREETQLFVAQLGSFGSDEAANNAAETLRTRSPNLLGRLALTIEPHNLTSGAQLYRVLTPAMAKTQVMQICDSLWAAKLACLVKRYN